MTKYEVRHGGDDLNSSRPSTFSIYRNGLRYRDGYPSRAAAQVEINGWEESDRQADWDEIRFSTDRST